MGSNPTADKCMLTIICRNDNYIWHNRTMSLCAAFRRSETKKCLEANGKIASGLACWELCGPEICHAMSSREMSRHESMCKRSASHQPTNVDSSIQRWHPQKKPPTYEKLDDFFHLAFLAMIGPKHTILTSYLQQKCPRHGTIYST